MQDYQKLYTILFNACTDAVEAMDFGTARTLLVRAQQEAEEQYISAEECVGTIHGTAEK